MALIQLYQFLLSIRLSFRVMSLSAVVGISDLGEGSIGKLSLIVLTFNLLAELYFLTFPKPLKYIKLLLKLPACHLALFVFCLW